MHKSRFRFFVLPILLLALLLPLCTGVHGADLGVERSVFQFLTAELGLNSAAACGVLANIEAESNFSLTAYGDGGTSYGLCQWHDGRFEALQSFCLLYGYDYWSLDGQLNYLAYELRTRYQSTYAALKRVANTSDGAYEAGYVWCVSFEVPANREEKGVIRGRTAQFKYWLRYGGSSDFSTSMGITSRGYSGALSDWSDSSSSFYWETDDNIEEPTAPISAPSSATQTPSPVERPTTPGGRIQHTGGFSRPLSSDSPIPLRTASYACLSARSCGVSCHTAQLPPGLPVPLCRRAGQALPHAAAGRGRAL